MREGRKTMTGHQICVEAVDTFGDGPQQIKAIEELAELQTVLARDMNCLQVTDEEIIDEIADVHIMTQQMAIIFGEKEVVQRINEKLERLKRMIDEENAHGHKEREA